MNGDVPWHIFMALHCVCMYSDANKQYVSENKDSTRENCCDCKRIWPNRGEIEKLLWSEMVQQKRPTSNVYNSTSILCNHMQ